MFHTMAKHYFAEVAILKGNQDYSSQAIQVFGSGQAFLLIYKKLLAKMFFPDGLKKITCLQSKFEFLSLSIMFLDIEYCIYRYPVFQTKSFRHQLVSGCTVGQRRSWSRSFWNTCKSCALSVTTNTKWRYWRGTRWFRITEFPIRPFRRRSISTRRELLVWDNWQLQER